jgi:sugar phosphate isomerase/epimerase
LKILEAMIDRVMHMHLKDIDRETLEKNRGGDSHLEVCL